MVNTKLKILPFLTIINTCFCFMNIQYNHYHHYINRSFVSSSDHPITADALLHTAATSKSTAATTILFQSWDKQPEGDDEQDDEDEDDGVTTNDTVSPHSCNVLGGTLSPCCDNVRQTGIGTGFYRNGYCSTGPDDLGRHTVCVQVTTEFLSYSKSVGNDLSTPVPQYMFPGLQDGDIWCLCAQRWVQAYQAGYAPKLFLKATHEKTLSYVPLEILRLYALDGDEADDILKELNEQRSKLDKLLGM